MVRSFPWLWPFPETVSAGPFRGHPWLKIPQGGVGRLLVRPYDDDENDLTEYGCEDPIGKR